MHAKVTARRLGLTCAVVLALFVGDRAQAETLDLTRAEAIVVARKAFLGGEPALADAIARQLVAADPKDVEALLLLAASEEALGRADSGYYWGQKAWAAARGGRASPALRYEIARQTAHAALTGENFHAAARWLNRSVAVAPDANAAGQSQRDLAQVRARMPLTYSASLQISPTDNLNNGASTGLLVVDDTVIGGISGWSVAHAGYLATAQVGAVWSLGVTPSGKARNSFGLTMTSVLHALTKAEAQANPTLRASDLDMWSLTGSWVHEIALPGADHPLALTVEATQNWYGGAAYAPSLRGKVDYDLPQRGQTAWHLSGVIEHQWQDAPSNGVNGISLGLDGTRALRVLNADLTYGISATALRSDWSNSTYDGAEAHLSLQSLGQIGPFQPSLGIGANWRHYAEYSLGFANVTDGRTDQGIWAQVGLTLPEVHIGVLSPTISLRSTDVRSNISKYQTHSTAVYLGLSAQF